MEFISTIIRLNEVANSASTRAINVLMANVDAAPEGAEMDQKE